MEFKQDTRVPCTISPRQEEIRNKQQNPESPRDQTSRSRILCTRIDGSILTIDKDQRSEDRN